MGKTCNNWNPAEWNKVYEASGENKKACIKENKAFYENMCTKDYETIEKCVDYAIKNKNHVAFAKFFFYKADQKKIFAELFEKYIDEYQEKAKNSNGKLLSWKNCKLMKPHYWRSWDIDYFSMETDEKSDCWYQKRMFQQWEPVRIPERDVVRIPERDVIVQICLYFGKNAEETNQLLIAAGYEKLYVLDIVDLVEMYYLNQYSQEQMDLQETQSLPMSGLENKAKKTLLTVQTNRLKTVKEKINEFLPKYLKNMVGVKQVNRKKIRQDTITEEEKEAIEKCKLTWNGATKVVIENSQNPIEDVSEKTKEQYGIEIQVSREEIRQDTITEEEKEAIEKCKLTWNGATKVVKKYFQNPIEDVSEETKEQYGIKILGNKSDIYFAMPNSEKNKGKGQIEYYLKWSKKEQALYRYEYKNIRLYGEETPLGYKISKEIQDIIEEQEKLKTKYTEEIAEESDASREVSLEGNFLTKYATEYFSEENLQAFIEGKMEKFFALGEKHYGYLRKTLHYLDTYDRYRKNMKESSLKLIATNNRVTIEEIVEQRKEFISAYCESKDKKDIEKFTIEKRRQVYLKIIDGIWKKYSEKKKDELLEGDGKGSFLKSRELLEGRNILRGETYQAEKDSEWAYVMALGSKGNLIKYALVTGREDDIGKYLVSAGYWEKDLLEMEKIGKEDASLLSRMDYLIIYAIKYRNALLRAWANNIKENEEIYVINAKKEFPFLQLLQGINRDIQFINIMKIIKWDIEFKNAKEVSDDKINDMKKKIASSEAELEKELVFPRNKSNYYE